MRCAELAGRFPDGRDTGSNCADFVTPPSTTLAAASAARATNIKVANVQGFGASQTIRIDTGANLETAVIATVGTAGATTVGAASGPGATVIAVASAMGFSNGQAITDVSKGIVRIADLGRSDLPIGQAEPHHVSLWSSRAATTRS